MEEKYLITIKGTMEQRGDTDTVELMTRGSLVHKDGAYYIVYKETETTGYEGCTTTVKVAEDARKVSMLRFGKQSSQLIIEKGTRHLCHYETGYGAISLGVAADVIEHELDENGGKLKFSYTLDSGAENFISRNLVDITVDKLPEAENSPVGVDACIDPYRRMQASTPTVFPYVFIPLLGGSSWIIKTTTRGRRRWRRPARC